MQSWNTRPSGHRKFVYENSSECARNPRDRGRYARDVIIKYAPPNWRRNLWPSRSKDWLSTLGQRSRADLADAQIKYAARSEERRGGTERRRTRRGETDRGRRERNVQRAN